ncbi:unnamed protein product [Withania somnifera]
MGMELHAEQAGYAEMENVEITDTDLYYYVRGALKSALQGDTDKYGELVKVMNHDEWPGPEKVALIVTCLKALSGSVSCLDIVHHQSLISSATSSGQYIDLCLEMLVSNFMPPDSFISLLNQPRGILRKGEVIDHVHSTLIFIAQFRIITERMPHIFTKEPLILTYVENMLKLECGAIGDLVGRTMLVAIMDRLIDLDKLDGLMLLTFEHLNFCKDEERLSQVFDTLLQSFQQTVLTAYKSKFAQFVLFYACSLDPENCGMRFADTLFHLFKTSRYPEWRMSAVAYLASYLARVKFLSFSFVAEYVESLLEWCSTYCSSQSGGINPKAHKELYAGCQAMMYVLCFRMRSMLSIPCIRSRISKHIEDILRHPLSPLMVMCSFSQYCKSYNAFFCFVFLNLVTLFSLFFIFIFGYFIWIGYMPGKLRQIGKKAGKGMDIANGGARSCDQDLDEFGSEMSKMSITPKVAQWFGGDMQMPPGIRPLPDSL